MKQMRGICTAARCIALFAACQNVELKDNVSISLLQAERAFFGATFVYKSSFFFFSLDIFKQS